MYDDKSLDRILFFDIETVPGVASLADFSPEMQHLWNEKFESLQRRMPDRFTPDETADYALRNGGGIFSEFAKIVCISVGYIYSDKDGNRLMRTRSFADDDEAKILRDFAAMLADFQKKRKIKKGGLLLCGHNIKEFDVPFICRRMLVHGMPLPPVLDVAGLKPWETPYLDTLELWKFGDYKSFTSLKLLCALFGIATPKDDIDGSQVATVYYEQHDLPRIAIYCEKDVVATAQVFLRLNAMPLLDPANVTHVE